MIKTLTSLSIVAAAAGLANAQPLPAPPTEKYSPAEEASCDAQVLNVYFNSGESDLNAASMAVLEAAQEQLDGCILGPVSLQANAPDAKTQSQAEQLAQARLDAVTDALASHELTGTRVNARFEAPASQAVSNAPMTRNVEVRLSAWAPQIG
ncbi:MAG: hypothetical protein ACE37M_15425 [Henriciella sp.]